jgi:hypothetical protein
MQYQRCHQLSLDSPEFPSIPQTDNAVHCTQWLISPPPGGQNPWITRSRSAPTKEALSSRPWTVELSLQDVLYDPELIRDLSDKEIANDYYEFTIIDRTPERKFTILDEVAMRCLS